MPFMPMYSNSLRRPGPSLHPWVPPPMPGAPIFPHVEFMHNLRWVHPGKFTSSVFFDGWRVAQDGHDTGMLIEHISVPHAGLVLQALTSKYKLYHGASAVKVQKEAVAIWDDPVATPSFCAVPCQVPATGSENNLELWSTVRIGASVDDLIRGTASAAFDMALDLVFFDGLDVAPFSVKDALKGLAKDVGKGLVSDFAKFAVKVAVDGPEGASGRIDAPIYAWGLEYGSDGLFLGTPGNPKAKVVLDYRPGDAKQKKSALTEGLPHVD